MFLFYHAQYLASFLKVASWSKMATGALLAGRTAAWEKARVMRIGQSVLVGHIAGSAWTVLLLNHHESLHPAPAGLRFLVTPQGPTLVKALWPGLPYSCLFSAHPSCRNMWTSLTTLRGGDGY